MQNKIPFHNITPLQSMKINIAEDGLADVWKTIETFKNPLQRCGSRKLLAKAIKPEIKITEYLTEKWDWKQLEKGE